MNLLQRWRRRAVPEATDHIDPDTGEIHVEAAPAPSPVVGERNIPSVNRGRSMQARVRDSLLLATIVLLALALLGWYYAAHLSQQRGDRERARRAAEARTAGDVRVPPLGRVDPPRLPASAAIVAASVTTEVFGAPPPLPLAPPPTPDTGTPTKTPAQLADERRLGQPVLWRGATGRPAAPGSIAGPASFADAGTPPSSLSNLLRPTPTPATRAQLLPTQRWLLPKGAFIDCTLETAIDSTYDGMVTCIGAMDVYGADGRIVLLERGTKYVGEKRGELRQGQGRVFVLWSEARTPTGVVVALASPGTDELGRTGLPGSVDKHFWDRFGAALLISVVDGAVQGAAQRGRERNGAIVVDPRGGRDVVTSILDDTLAIPPTVVKNQGDRIQVLVARDVDFRSVYALGTDPAAR